MAFCRECGQKINDDVTTCPSCGAAARTARKKSAQTTTQAAQAVEQPTAQAKPAAQPVKKPGQSTSTDQSEQNKTKKNSKEPVYDEQEDIKTNKMMAALAYLLFFLPLVTEPAKTSKFARFHANQGLVFIIFYAVIIIITRILDAIFYNAFAWNTWGLWVVIDLIIWIIYVVMAAFAARNAYRAYKGKWVKIPLIGRINIIK